MFNALNLRKFLLVLGDIVCLYASLWGTIFFGFGAKISWKLIFWHLPSFSILYFFWLVIFYIFGLYELKTAKTNQVFFAKIWGAILTCLGVGMVFFYLTPFFGITPKTNLILNIVILSFLFFGWRKFFYSLFSSLFLNKIAIVGDGALNASLTEEITLRPYLGYKLIALDKNQDLLSQIKEKKIDTIIIPNDLASNSWLVKNLYRCLPAHVNFMDWTKAYEIICEKIPVSFVAQTWFLENIKEGERGFYNKIKRLLDIILASILLIATSPLWPLIALSIKLEDGGPILYRQERVGKDGKTFFLLKFRSMQIGAEEKTGAVWAQKEDPRTTKIGRLLRNAHLDEIPQMINVLRNDIGLVGPRPERPEFVEKLEKEISHYHIRHLIKPGFTGWAQLKFRYGRSVMDSREKFQYDLYYLKNRSFVLDLGILLKTLQLFFKKE